MRRNTLLTTLLLFTGLAVAPGRGQAEGAAAAWAPPPEPPAWAAVRRSLLEKGPPAGLARRDWIFMRALDRQDLRAGEYMADLETSADRASPVATFRAVVLVQRPAKGPAWQVRERRMRALCAERSLQVLDSNGSWVAYAGTPDPDAPARLAWICSSARTEP